MSQDNDVSKKIQKRSIQSVISALKNETRSDKVRNHLKNIDNLLESYGNYYQKLDKALLSGSKEKLFEIETSLFRQVKNRIRYVLDVIQYERNNLPQDHLDLLHMLISEIETYIEECL